MKTGGVTFTLRLAPVGISDGFTNLSAAVLIEDSLEPDSNER